jgi:hypothetical protein
MQSDYKSDVSNASATYPISGTVMTYNSGDNTLEVVHSGGETTYASGSLLRIFINENDDYEIEDPGQSIGSYNFNKELSHSNLICFRIANRSGIGVTDFRDFRLKDDWDLDSCAIGLQLDDSKIKVGFDSNSSPCYTETQVSKTTTCV